MSSFLSLSKKKAYVRCWTHQDSQQWLSTSANEEAWSTASLRGLIPFCSFPRGLQGLRLDVSQVLYAMVLPFLVTIQISPSVCFSWKLQQQSQHAYRLRTWSSRILLETPHFGKVLSQEFLIWLTFSGVTWTLGTSAIQTSTREVDPAGSPFWSCVRGSAVSAPAQAIFLQSQEIHLSPYTLFYSWYFSMFLQNLFHSNNQ